MNKDASSYSLRDSSRSFPSGKFRSNNLKFKFKFYRRIFFFSPGHASISLYTSLFLVWYLQCRIPKLQSLFFIPFLQAILLVWNCLVSISRITDHRHHWHDVLAGALLGIAFAFYTCHILSHNFCDESRKPAVLSVNGSSSNNNRRSVRRLLSTISAKEEFTLNNLE